MFVGLSIYLRIKSKGRIYQHDPASIQQILVVEGGPLAANPFSRAVPNGHLSDSK